MGSTRQTETTCADTVDDREVDHVLTPSPPVTMGSRWQFDWDEGNRPKCERRVPIADIEATFDNRRAIRGQTGTPERWWAVDPEKRIFLIFPTLKSTVACAFG
jgi:hypothetical protein